MSVNLAYIQVVHNGTVGTAYGPYTVGQSVGSIYISDILRREDMPGILSKDADDQYIDPNTTKFLLQTPDALLSVSKGIIHRWSSMGVFSVTLGVTGVTGF